MELQNRKHDFWFGIDRQAQLSWCDGYRSASAPEYYHGPTAMKCRPQETSSRVWPAHGFADHNPRGARWRWRAWFRRDGWWVRGHTTLTWRCAFIFGLFVLLKESVRRCGKPGRDSTVANREGSGEPETSVKDSLAGEVSNAAKASG